MIRLPLDVPVRLISGAVPPDVFVFLITVLFTDELEPFLQLHIISNRSISDINSSIIQFLQHLT